jgi:hypothetical protein
MGRMRVPLEGACGRDAVVLVVVDPLPEVPLHGDGPGVRLRVLAGLLRLERAVLGHAAHHLGAHRVEHVAGGEARVGRGVPLLDARVRGGAEHPDRGKRAELLAHGARRGGLGGLAGAHLLGERARAAGAEPAVGEQLADLDEARAAAVADVDGGDADGADDPRARRGGLGVERAVAVGELEEEVEQRLGPRRGAPGGERLGWDPRAEERRQGFRRRERQRPHGSGIWRRGSSWWWRILLHPLYSVSVSLGRT